MRIIIKGGVWKNTEDEILKAAVSKYGKNQWARISSLLVRKTPKQCKARWYEWLDPAIKKTEWSKEEDEKLLHLAKLMPTQWRTIAPVVGRTATQCLERYQKLLDDAEQKENEELGLAGPGDEAGPSADDVRRLRPGEIDPDPETKPARPDPIDMDEDEKEMLSEARARLANTQGKKAKRKARERQLEEARRLAMLQKRRELKAAGIIMRHKPKKGGMDYQADIPFEKKAAPGFYDTTEEDARSFKAPVGQTLRQLEGVKRKKDDEEAERRKRQKKGKENKDAEAAFVPSKDNAIQKLKEAEQISKRRKLMLPGPQVDAAELEEIVKIGQAGESARELVAEGSNEASAGLLEDYSALAHAKNARTPRTAPQHDNIMAEARNLLNATLAQTPLLGEENAPIHEVVGRGTGYEGATPRSHIVATPNPLATPFRKGEGGEVGATPGPGATPGSVVSSATGRPGATPLRTPMRDNLNINVDGTPRVGETPREQRLRQKDTKRQLELGFENIPAPMHQYEVVLPEDEEEEGDGKPRRTEDAAERDARLKAMREEEERKALERRTQAVKRGLPRPMDFDPESLLRNLHITESSSAAGDKSLSEAERLVAIEFVRLLEHDAIVHPVPGGPHVGGLKSDLAFIEDEALAAARAMVHAEVAAAVGFPGATEQQVKTVIVGDLDLSQEFWDSGLELAFDARSKSWEEASTMSPEDRVAGLAARLEVNRENMANEAAKAAKAEKKLSKTLGGYQARSKALGAKLTTAHDELNRANIEFASFSRLASNEEGAVQRRIESLRAEVEKLESRGRDGQARYKEMSEEKSELMRRIEDMTVDIQMRESEAINEQALAAMEEEETA